MSAAINPVVVMDYMLKFVGSKFKRSVTAVQVIESLMSIAIPIFALFSSEKGLSIHLETLCMIGSITSFITLTFCLSVLVEFPNSSKDQNSLRWIAFVNGRDLPSDLSI